MDLLQACCKSRKLWDQVLGSIRHALIVTDLDGRILFSSSVIEKILGFEPHELNGKDFSVILTCEDLDCLYPNLLYLTRKQMNFEGELMLLRKGGDPFIAFVVAKPCFDPVEGESIVLFSIQDVGKQKEVERSFSKPYYEDLVKIANGVAHEIRNPLVGIGGFVNRLFKTCPEGHDHYKYYDYIMKNLKRIENLVQKVESFSHLPSPSLREMQFKEVIDDALQPYLHRIEEQNIELTMSLEQPGVRADKNLVLRVFSILIENALDAMPESGSIAIRGETRGNDFIIEVTDTGTGISPKDLPYIFNPFFSTKANGAGIDLAIVKRVMESHGGEVEVESKAGEGASFLLRFPLERRRAIRITRLQDSCGAEAEKIRK